MSAATRIITQLVEEARDQRGFLQHSPVRTGVWRRLLERPGEKINLLMIPLRSTTAGRLCVAVNEAMEGARGTEPCTYNQSVACGQFTFDTLVIRLLPLSRWWQRKIEPDIDLVLDLAASGSSHSLWKNVCEDLKQARASGRSSGLSPDMLWCIRMLGITQRALSSKSANPQWPGPSSQVKAAAELFKKARRKQIKGAGEQLFAVAINRPAVPCLRESVRTIKGDASREVFDIRCNRITWAVIDSGIDRRHPAFGNGKGGDRIVETLDFTEFGTMLSLASSANDDDHVSLRDTYGLSAAQVRKISRSIRAGDPVDWEIVAAALRVDRGDDYFDALDPHGTQVAGIVGGAPCEEQINGQTVSRPGGVCPDIKLLDLRVIRGVAGDENTEFYVISALQYIDYLNRNKDKPVVHGINMSLSIPHSVTDYGCGRTPICDECDRLVSSGVVVVAAAGNYGFDRADITGPAKTGGYRDISITDPGNTESVITVGSTHRKHAHRYGISYFSSRGPTGDGRAKPDLVAPGESIECPSRNNTYEACSGTSMSAPHVSGAAALLMARHTGLIGEPGHVKDVLCANATDLKRASESQGRGLLDALRALQAL
ncbi:MAG: S8 family serine peptidase [Gammaproteobacteria bacterium]|nr:S8 family serine peptidase [Gammaproteobacteria bacterium]